MGAGIAAIFRAPLAGALFASEVLYWSPEFEPEVIIPAGVASVVSYCTFGAAFGYRPLFLTPDLTFDNPWQLAPYLLLVLWMVVLAFAYTRAFYTITNWFHRLRAPRMVKPAIGAASSGLVGLVLYVSFGCDARLLSVLSFGYGALQDAMTHDTTAGAGVLFAIALGKVLTTGLTIGSGGSGGVFGPSMVIGGCGGGALGIVLNRVAPELVPHPASFVLVGMAGFFAAAAKTPFSTLVIVSEMTGGYHLLLPALWVCVLAFMLSDQRSLYASQFETRTRSPAHRGTIGRLLVGVERVAQFVSTNREFPALDSKDSLATVIERFSKSRLGVLPVLDHERALLGSVDIEEVLVATQERGPNLCAADVMRTDVVPLAADDPLDIAQERFVESDLLALPVVRAADSPHVIGIVKRFDIASAYVRSVHGLARREVNTPALPALASSTDTLLRQG
jgi:CIC family chloride channel protein